ncbi:helix-turn-helix domain-containing protein [Aminobacter niigataensis]|uniref:helix-turn-helix domain-containing protein n=1 Tax=Aminobacter niigataensis TaxID=83265 RepID=UPI001606DECF
MKQRISLATRLLLAGKDAVGEVAFQAGFVSPGHFSRVFRQMTDRWPTETLRSQ